MACRAAWFFPANCNADDFYQATPIGVLKPQWGQVDVNGDLIIWDEASYGCNGYSAANAADVVANSEEQYVLFYSDCTGLPGARLVWTDPIKRTAFINDVINFLNSTGFTGVELDFECFWQFNATDWDNYVAFLNIFVPAINSAGYEVNIDLPAISQDQWGIDIADLNGINFNCINIMAYDYFYGLDPATTANSPNWWVSSAIAYYQAELTNDASISLGIANYGYYGVCGGTGPYTTFAADTASSLPGYSTGSYDPGSGEYSWTDGTNCYWVSDSNSLDVKEAIADAAGVDKVSVWSIGSGDWFTTPEDPACLPLVEGDCCKSRTWNRRNY